MTHRVHRTATRERKNKVIFTRPAFSVIHVDVTWSADRNDQSNVSTQIRDRLNSSCAFISFKITSVSIVLSRCLVTHPSASDSLATLALYKFIYLLTYLLKIPESPRATDNSLITCHLCFLVAVAVVWSALGTVLISGSCVTALKIRCNMQHDTDEYLCNF